MSDIKNENALGAECCERERKIFSVRGESSCDHILPDYMGDVKKLLKCSVSVIPCDKFIGGGEISFLNTLTYYVMYLDRDDVLTEATFTSEYEHTESVDESFIDGDADTRVQNLTIRLQGPRKICAKASLTMDIYMMEEKPLPTVELPANAETRESKVKVHAAEYFAGKEREYAEEIGRLSGTSCDDVEVIKCSVHPVIDTCEEVTDGICLKGSALGAVILRVGEDIVRLEKRLPIEDVISGDYIEHNGAAYCGFCYATDVTANVNNEVSEAQSVDYYSSVVINFTTECYARRDGNREYTLTTDAFVTGMHTDCTYEDFSYSEFLGSSLERRKLSYEIKRDESLLRDIIDCDAQIKNLRWSVLGEEVVMSGDIAICCVASGSEPTDCYTVKHDSEFEERIKFSGANENCQASGRIQINDISVSFDTEKIYVSVTLSVSALVEESKCLSVLKSVSCEERTDNNKHSVTVYYPKSDDTVWSIAKEYGVSVETLMKYNSVADLNLNDSISLERVIIVNN